MRTPQPFPQLWAHHEDKLLHCQPLSRQVELPHPPLGCLSPQVPQQALLARQLLLLKLQQEHRVAWQVRCSQAEHGTSRQQRIETQVLPFCRKQDLVSLPKPMLFQLETECWSLFSKTCKVRRWKKLESESPIRSVPHYFQEWWASIELEQLCVVGLTRLSKQRTLILWSSCCQMRKLMFWPLVYDENLNFHIAW